MMQPRGWPLTLSPHHHESTAAQRRVSGNFRLHLSPPGPRDRGCCPHQSHTTATLVPTGGLGLVSPVQGGGLVSSTHQVP